MRAASIAVSAVLVSFAAAVPSDAQKLPNHPPLERDGGARLSGLLAAGYGLAGAIGTFVLMQRGSSLYLCQSNFDTTNPTTAEHLKVLAAQLQNAACVAVVG